MSQLNPEQADLIENVVSALITAFDIHNPPIPVELMLQRPRPGMWKEVNLSELSTAFINIKQRYSPRMSVSRLLVRMITRYEWGSQRGLDHLIKTEEDMRALARAIMMPHAMLDVLPIASRTPITISMRFEV